MSSSYNKNINDEQLLAYEFPNKQGFMYVYYPKKCQVISFGSKEVDIESCTAKANPVMPK